MKILCIICFFWPFVLWSQNEVRHSITCDLKLPTPIQNRALKATTDGIADLSVAYQYPFLKGAGLGAGVSYLHMKINEFALASPGALIEGKMNRYAPFAKLFYQKQTSTKFILEASCKVGYSWVNYSSVFCAQDNLQSQDQGVFIEPQVAAHMFAQDNFSIGLVFSYGFNQYDFSPASLCMDSFPGYADSDYEGSTQTFSVGFAFSVFLRQDRR